jgi:hypothetical protein
MTPAQEMKNTMMVMTRLSTIERKSRRSFSGSHLTVQMKFLDACFMKHFWIKTPLISQWTSFTADWRDRKY